LYVFSEKLCEQGFPLQSKTIRKIGCEWLQANTPADHPCQSMTSMSYKWEKGLFKRKPQLKKQKPRNISVQRAMCTSVHTINKFFNKYTELVDQYDIPGQNIWNIDETGVDTIPVVKKVVGLKGKVAHMIVPQERGTRTSMATFINATGEHFSPMVIHQGINVQPAWYTYAPDDVYIRAAENGYMTKPLFLEYSDLFLDWLESQGRLENQTHLLLFDGHSTHIHNYTAIQAFEHVDVHVLLLPAHSSHFLQPLDKNPFSCLKHWWQHFLEKFNRENCGTALNKVNFFKVFNLAWYKAFTPHNIRLGFIRTGIFPVDRTRIPKDMLAINKCFQSKLFLGLNCVFFVFCVLF
jgi:hypothetical protein